VEFNWINLLNQKDQITVRTKRAGADIIITYFAKKMAKKVVRGS